MADQPTPPTPPTPPETPPTVSAPASAPIPPLNIAEEMKDSYLNYAMSVIVSRALPDVRDGLKPSQRRILVAMNDLNLGPSSSTSKCASIVGETMKRYHPHGEQTIYPTLVRLAQNWNMRYRLVHPQGNFGSVAGLPPAAMRYCVTGETLVRTLNGTRRIDQIADAEPNSDVNLFLEVFNGRGQPVVASKLFHSGDHPTLRLRTREGFEVTGTHNHPLLCLDKVDGTPTLRWRVLSQIAPGTKVVLARQIQEDLEEISAYDRHLAILTGGMIAEGFVSSNRAGFNNTDRAYFDAVLAAFDEVVGGPRYTAERTIRSGSRLYELDVHNLNSLRESPLSALVGQRSGDKRVPDYIWNGSRELKRVFLQALYEGDGSSSILARSTISISYSTRSRQLARDVQILLLEFGIVSRQACSENGEIKVFISNRRDARLFASRVGFLGVKQSKLLSEITQVPQASRALASDHVPYLGQYIRENAGSTWTAQDWLNRHNIDRMERWERDGEAILTRIASPAVRDLASDLMAQGYYYATVDSITDAGIQAVYSLRIEADCHSFITNGFVSHNTEARLTNVAAEMLADLERETVDFGDNYDGKFREPLVLPSKFPNLLVNGSDGIAVGMATDIPPHNLAEVCTSLIRLIDNPEANLFELMAEVDGQQGIQGPDFPTGGEVFNYRGLIEAYLTGRGKITLRARAEIIEDKKSARIVIREVPYQQTRERIITAIADLIKDERISNVRDLRDESSERNGEPVKIVLYLTTKGDPHMILNQLYEFSPLKKTVSIINLALVDGRPEILPLKRMLEEFLRHRSQVIRRRTEYLLREAKRRSHILEGQLIAMASLDDVIRIVRSAPSRADAKINLQGLEVSAALMARAVGEENFRALQREIGVAVSYRMTEAQAEAVVRLQLGQLAALERDEIMKEYRELREKIGEYETLLSSEQNILNVIKEDLEDLRTRYGDKRLTTINQEELTSLDMLDLIPEEQMAVTLTHNGYIKRLPLRTYRTQHRGGRGVSGGAQREDDFVEHFFTASSHDYLLCFTNRGQLYWLKVYDIPEQGRTSAGRFIAQVLSLREEEKISSILAVRDFEDETAAVLMATRCGIVKKTPLKDYSRVKKGGIIGISLDEGDTLIGVALVKPGDEVLLTTRNGMAIRFDEAQTRSMGRNTRGVKGISFKKPDDEVVGLIVADPEGSLLTVCANGYGKQTPFGANQAGDMPETEEGESEAVETEATEATEPIETGETDEETLPEGAAATNSSFYYRKQKRGGSGVVSIKVSDRNGPVVGVASVRPGDQVILITMQGMVNRTRVDEIREAGRNTQGVSIMKPRDGDRVISVVRVPPEEAVDTPPAATTEGDEAPLPTAETIPADTAPPAEAAETPTTPNEE